MSLLINHYQNSADSLFKLTFDSVVFFFPQCLELIVDAFKPTVRSNDQTEDVLISKKFQKASCTPFH